MDDTVQSLLTRLQRPLAIRKALIAIVIDAIVSQRLRPVFPRRNNFHSYLGNNNTAFAVGESWNVVECSFGAFAATFA